MSVEMTSPSLVSEVLAATASLEKNNLQSQFLESCRRIEEIKYEVSKSVSNISSEIHAVVSGVEEHSKELEKLSVESDFIKNDIQNLKPQLLAVVNQSDKVGQELQKATVLSDILKVLVETNNSFCEFDVHLKKGNFYEAAMIIEKCLQNVKSLKYCFTESLDIIGAINAECTVKNERLKYELGSMWSRMFLWNCDNDTGVYKLSIFGADDDSKAKAISFLKTLAKLNLIEQRLKSFGTNFLNYLVKPILSKSVSLNITKENVYLEIQVSENNRSRTDPEEVFKNLSELFNFMNENFLNIVVSTPLFQNEVPFARIFGKCLSNDFCEALISEGLLESTQRLRSEAYTTIAECATNLQNQLVDIEFLDDDANVFGHAQNFNSIISNKMCQEIFSLARKTMKKELHKTLRVHLKASESVSELDDDECSALCAKKISEVYDFPDCVISSFIEELLKQLKELSIQASCCKALAAPRLYFAARYICELFCDIVPIYHQHNIAMFPQQTAIHHNNCMYLAHELLMLSATWQSQSELKVQTSADAQLNIGNELVISFVDLSDRLKSIGAAALLAQMKRQKQQLMEFLQDGSVFRNLTTIADFLPKGKRALHQCLHQLTSLRQLWIDVLPPDVYLKAMGTLCNSVIEEMIFQVTSQEDITEKITEHLGTLFEILLSDMPPLFQVKKYETISDLSLCQKYVSKWTKFQELKWLIVSSLRDIVERWAEGAGPLAMVFTPEEVKQLIRALFQNTERRSAALHKIVSLTN